MIVASLLLISFILHGVSFYWIYLMRKQSAAGKDIEQLLAAYTEEMKTENEALIHRLELMQRRDDQTEPAVSGIERVDDHEPRETLSAEQAESDSLTLPVEKVTDQYAPSLEAQVLSLADQGMSTEEIAKQLHIGRREVDLMSRLSKSNGES